MYKRPMYALDSWMEDFDPFTDANDDYAVLEWMRENWQGRQGHHGHWHQAAHSLWWRWDEYEVMVPYQIGDYARAALKVIKEYNNEETK